MGPLHPDDALRLAEDHAEALHDAWPRNLCIRPAIAARLRLLASWVDPQGQPVRPLSSFGLAADTGRNAR